MYHHKRRDINFCCLWWWVSWNQESRVWKIPWHTGGMAATWNNSCESFTHGSLWSSQRLRFTKKLRNLFVRKKIFHASFLDDIPRKLGRISVGFFGVIEVIFFLFNFWFCLFYLCLVVLFCSTLGPKPLLHSSIRASEKIITNMKIALQVHFINSLNSLYFEEATPMMLRAYS